MSAVVSVCWNRLLCYWLHPITPVVGALHGDTDNICDNLSPYFYRVVMPQCLPVTFRSLLGAVMTSNGILQKTILPPNSDKIEMWRFLRNRQLILRLHKIFRALIYWAHRAFVLAIAWFSCYICAATLVRQLPDLPDRLLRPCPRSMNLAPIKSAYASSY